MGEESHYKGKVLFVDDTQVNLILGRKLLSNLGLTVITAQNGQEAINCCKDETFQLIFMDLEMPELGGVDATKAIREQKLSFAPIVALTGRDDNKSTRQLCRQAQMNGFLEKPIKKEKLIPILDNVFHS